MKRLIYLESPLLSIDPEISTQRDLLIFSKFSFSRTKYKFFYTAQPEFFESHGMEKIV